MNFHQGTDRLTARVTQEELAAELDVSIPAIRQARLKFGAKAHRPPPKDWQRAVIRLAEEKVWHFRKLIEDVRVTNSETADV